MSKSILVINTPKSCEDCPILLLRPKFNCGEYDWKNNIHNKVEFVCPLKPLPKRKEFDNQIPYEKNGWNDCLNEILGETE